MRFRAGEVGLEKNQRAGVIMAAMRTSPIIGRKAWFGPRRFGWGLEPVSAEGWLVTFLFAAVSILVRRQKLGPRWLRYALGGGFLALAVLMGSAPGGAGARSDFDAARAAGAG
jgi:hypothetical protein